MRRADFATESGLESYDIARWSDWTPRYDRVHVADHMETLLQLAPKDATGTNETLVPESKKHVLMFWTEGAVAVDGRIANVAQRRGMATWDGIFLPEAADSWWASSPNSVHGCFHVHLAQDLIEEISLECDQQNIGSFAPLYGFKDNVLTGLSQIAFTLVGEPSKPSRLIWDTLARAIALRLWQLNKSYHKRMGSKGGLANWQLQRVLEYIRSRIGDEITLSELASIVGISTYHFCRAFKQSTGVPPHRYQIMLRMELAKDLLARSTLPMSDVASAVGYEGQSHFGQIFRREIGVTPSSYRRQVV